MTADAVARDTTTNFATVMTDASTNRVQKNCPHNKKLLGVLAQMVVCLPLVQQDRGSIPGGVVNFHLIIFNLGARGVEM